MVVEVEVVGVEREGMLVVLEEEWDVGLGSKCLVSGEVGVVDVKIEYVVGKDFDNVLLIF
ncbi:hypothetical protein [Staphylococcus aureus]|uniref:hypothetical protein n=1 Tax=Staphylococcus aureus TaxID=1280 RepID=UPI0016429E97|nr:hypothetical protein [Staphylococcus aureus]